MVVSDLREVQVTSGYNAAGQLTSLSREATDGGPTIDTAFGYNDAGWLESITHTRSLAGQLSSFLYDYDYAGRLTDYTGPDGSLSYTYDNTDQLVGVTGSRAEDYGYDLNGNRNTTGYQTGGNNQLLSDGTFTYTYDNEGNRKTKTRISDGQVWEYTWDHRNRLTRVVEKNSGGTVVKQVDYTYDVWDRRIGVSVDPDGAGSLPATDTWTVYDGANPYADFDDTGSLTTRYLYGPAVDFLLARVDATGDEDWYLTDNLGSVRQIVDSDGAVLHTTDYDSFGNPTDSADNEGDRFKYTAREWDAAVDLYFYRARYYDPSTGRFISEDPIGFAAGDANLSRYVGNNPTNGIDPMGLQVLDEGRSSINDAVRQRWELGIATGAGVTNRDRMEDIQRKGQIGAAAAAAVVFVDEAYPIILQELLLAPLPGDEVRFVWKPAKGLFALIGRKLGIGGASRVLKVGGRELTEAETRAVLNYYAKKGARNLDEAAEMLQKDMAKAAVRTKNEAREILGKLGLPAEQAAAANRAIGRATRSSTIQVLQGEGGT